FRARHLLLIAAGENHPLIKIFEVILYLCFFLFQEFDLACKFIQSADFCLVYNSQFILSQSALLNHVMARAHACRGDFRTALVAEKETFTVYKSIFGDDHEKVR
ncbi:hypothetical protein PFISCL1PPCAC_11177, partial [Pristionchus fissidentatus]